MKYKYIAFDIDGTLIDTQDTFTYSFSRTIKEIKGQDVPPDELVKYFGLPSLAGVEQVGFPDADAALELWEEHYRRMAQEKSHPYRGVHEALGRIVAAGIKIGDIIVEVDGTETHTIYLKSPFKNAPDFSTISVNHDIQDLIDGSVILYQK